MGKKVVKKRAVVKKREINIKENKLKQEIKDIQRKLVLSKFKDHKAKFFYEFLFWAGFTLVLLTYVTKNEYFLIAGIISILFSLFIYELYHKPEKKIKSYFYILYLIVIFIIGYIIYKSLDRVLYIFSLPIGKSWLLYAVIAFIILDFLVFIIKSKTKRYEKKENKKEIKKIKKLLFKKISLRAEKRVEKKTSEKRIKKPFLKRILFGTKSRMKKEKPAKPEIRILKIKAEKKEKPAKPESIKFKKFSKFLTYLFLAIILFSGIYKGVVYMSPLISDQLLFYAMVVIIFFTLLVAVAHSIVHRRAKLKKAKEEMPVVEATEVKQEKTALEAEAGAGVKSRVKTYKTDIDLLYELVKNRGRAKLSFLAKTFNVDKKIIEDWAELLEEHGLLKIHYPAIGEPELVILKEAKKK